MVPVLADEVPLSENNKLKPTAETVGPTIARELTEQEEYERVLCLRHDVLQASVGAATPPIVHGIDMARVRPSDQALQVVCISSQLPNVCEMQTSNIAINQEITVATTPLPIAQIPHQVFNNVFEEGFTDAKLSFYQKASEPLSTENLQLIDKLTLGQSSNNEWYAQRKGSLTSSKFSIALYGTRRAQIKLIHETINGKRTFKNLPLPMKWGRMNEDLASSTYVKNLMASHYDVQISHPGLAVHPTIPFLRSSPDLITFCSCHGLRAVEIKCPWASRNITPEEATDRKVIDYITKECGKFVLHKRKRGYFDQIQGIMACTTLTRLPAHLAIWTKAGLMVVDVPFNQEYWNDAEKKLQVFFREKIIPAILIPTCITVGMDEIQNGISKINLSEDQMDSSDSCVNMNKLQDEEQEVEDEQEDDLDFCEDDYEEEDVQKQENDEEYEQSFQVIIQELDTDKKKNDQMNEDQEVPVKSHSKEKEELEKWLLGCKHMCIDGKQSSYS